MLPVDGRPPYGSAIKVVTYHLKLNLMAISLLDHLELDIFELRLKKFLFLRAQGQ